MQWPLFDIVSLASTLHNKEGYFKVTVPQVGLLLVTALILASFSGTTAYLFLHARLL